MIPAEQAPIKNARINMEFNGFDFEAVKVFAAFMNKLSMKEQYELGESFDEEAMGMFADLLTTDLNAKIALNLGNGGGKANSDFAIRFIGDGSKSGYADIVTVADILNAIEVDLNMKADKGALALTPAMMFTDSPEAQMVLADGGDHFYTKATLRGTAVELNDNFFPLQDMVGEMLDMPIEALLAMGGL